MDHMTTYMGIDDLLEDGIIDEDEHAEMIAYADAYFAGTQ